MAVNDAPPIDDHYATLGVDPRSEAAVIRAAYLALMRRHHPDTSASPASVERAQAIIAAFAVLGDPERRLHYDWYRRRAAEAVAQRPGPRGRRRLVLAAALIALLLAVMVIPRLAPDRAPVPRPAPPIPSTAPPGAAPSRPIPAAARPDPTGPAAIADQALPSPPIAATPRAAPAPSERPEVLAEDKIVKPVVSASSECGPASATTACQDDNLAALDRLALAFYGQSLRAGSPTKRAALLISRSSLLGRLEACRSEPCLRSAYLTHMREISAIVESRPPP